MRRQKHTTPITNPLHITSEEWTRIVQMLGLSPREAEILELIVRGCGDKQIAKKLGMSVNTLRTHLRHIFLRLDIGSRLELAMHIFSLLRNSITENG